MKKIYLLGLLLLISIFTIISCSQDDSDEYVPVSPVVLDVTQVPYPKLSDYKFFEGEIKNLQPSYKVIPYKPASDLFSDYAHKKRFVWMPPGTQATFNGADNTLEFPVGAVLIKTFYYDNVQPGNVTRIIETRLMIKKRAASTNDSGWEPYNYIWNDEQTEAFLDTQGEGIFFPIEWKENGVDKSVYYKVPAFTECRTCHKINPNQATNGEIIVPIGVKPQNLNYSYDYGTSQQNQLQKWISEGYLENNMPATINSTVDWKDTSKSLELRARSYIDINCAHCHRVGGHCDYAPMRLNFSNPDLNTFGVCLPITPINGLDVVINAGNAAESEMIYRISSTDGSEMMPLIGRSLVHDEGIALMTAWINSLTPCE